MTVFSITRESAVITAIRHMLLQDERSRSFCRTRGFDVAQLMIRPVGINGGSMLWQASPPFDTFISKCICVDAERLTVTVELELTRFIRLGPTLNIFDGSIQLTLVTSLSPSHHIGQEAFLTNRTEFGTASSDFGTWMYFKTSKNATPTNASTSGSNYISNNAWTMTIRSRRPLTCQKTPKGLLMGRLGCGTPLERVKGKGAGTQWICPRCIRENPVAN